MALTHATAAAQTDNSTLPRLTTSLYTAREAGMPPSRIRSIIPNRDAAAPPAPHSSGQPTHQWVT